MEENNRKGPGVFYAVVGVATLVVAIIGATFAYFSASASAETNITGETLDISGTFDVAVTKLNKVDGQAAEDKLVPAKFGTSNDALTTANAADAVTSALKNKCEQADENGGYTGCHVWKVTATTGQDLSSADLVLNITAPKGENWSYVVFKNNTNLTELDGTAGTVSLSAASNAVGTFTTTGTNVNMHNGDAMKKATGDGVSATYYVMVYLQNTDAPQNTTENSGTDETGTYNGTVTFSAAGGGKVSASFTLE